MLAPLLNKEFVLSEYEVVSSYLRGLSRTRGHIQTVQDIQLENLKHVIEETGTLDAFAQSLQTRHPSLIQQPSSSFIAQDPLISNMQSALELSLSSDNLRTIRPSDQNLRCVTDQTVAWFDPTRGREQRLFNAFSITDVGWVSCKIAEAMTAFRDKHPFVEKVATASLKDDNLRIVLVGDWGTGLPRARKVATRIRELIGQGQAKGLAQHVIHLGDVYYAGWEFEYEKRFLPYWPVSSTDADLVGSWCLNGNHDMYSGGYGYFDLLLAERRFRAQQGSSTFHLTNSSWDVVGLDTAWEDKQINDFQQEMLAALNKNDKRKLILSHHQPFSSYEQGSKVLFNQVKGSLAGCDVVWCWGHEHRCMTFGPYDGIHYGCCIGHGGVPVYALHNENEPCPPPGTWEYREYLDSGVELWSKFGFAVLDFTGPALTVRFLNEDGEESKVDRI